MRRSPFSTSISVRSLSLSIFAISRTSLASILSAANGSGWTRAEFSPVREGLAAAELVLLIRYSASIIATGHRLFSMAFKETCAAGRSIGTYPHVLRRLFLLARRTSFCSGRAANRGAGFREVFGHGQFFLAPSFAF